jgi:hypothetical protein
MPEPRIGALPIPATPLSELSRWQLDIRCGQCRRDRSLRLEVLAKRYGGNVRIIDVVERLRCAQQREGGRCGAKPSRVVMAEVHAFGGTSRRMREITVISERAIAAEMP